MLFSGFFQDYFVLISIGRGNTGMKAAEARVLKVFFLLLFLDSGEKQDYTKKLASLRQPDAAYSSLLHI